MFSEIFVHTSVSYHVNKLPFKVVRNLLFVVLVSLQITGSVGTPTAGESYYLTCTVSGADLLGYNTVASYQWRKDGNILAGETVVVLSFSPFRLSHAGQYTCEVAVGNTTFSVTREIVASRKMPGL
jgi:hypothetical protein